MVTNCSDIPTFVPTQKALKTVDIQGFSACVGTVGTFSRYIPYKEKIFFPNKINYFSIHYMFFVPTVPTYILFMGETVDIQGFSVSEQTSEQRRNFLKMFRQNRR